MDEFLSAWTALNTYQRYSVLYTNEHNCMQANKRLPKQKPKTGAAILGKPSAELLSDLRFSGSLLIDLLYVGEQHALAALTSEILVMLVCNIESKSWHKYISRSQYF